MKVIAVSDPRITQRIPLVTLDTRLRELPTEWRRFIEPKIDRRYSLPCWVWIGSHDSIGRPLMPEPDIDMAKRPGRPILARRFIAKLFYDFPDTYFVNFVCGTINCLNPAHLDISNTAGHRENRR